MSKATSVASSLFEIGALSGSATELHAGDYRGALTIAVVGFTCVIIVAGGVALAEVIKARVRWHVRKQELEVHKAPEEKSDA